jgi:hypothetical protein
MWPVPVVMTSWWQERICTQMLWPGKTDTRTEFIKNNKTNKAELGLSFFHCSFFLLRCKNICRLKKKRTTRYCRWIDLICLSAWPQQIPGGIVLIHFGE